MAVSGPIETPSRSSRAVTGANGGPVQAGVDGAGGSGRPSEAAPAHVVRNRVEAAYARSDVFDRRRLLMDDWAAGLDGKCGQVVPLRRQLPQCVAMRAVMLMR